MTALQENCSLCEEPAVARCPRCERRVCVWHAPGPGPGSEAEVDDGVGDGVGHCSDCERAIEVRVQGRLGERVAVAAAAGIGGMIGSAFLVMLAAGTLGLAPEFILLMMLIAELGVGCLSAYAADQRMQRWLRRRASSELCGLPQARLLDRHHDD